MLHPQNLIYFCLMNEIFQKCTVSEQLKLRTSLAVPQRFALELIVDLANQSNRIILFFKSALSLPRDCSCVEFFAQIDFNWNFHFYLRFYANSVNRFSFICLSFRLSVHPSVHLSIWGINFGRLSDYSLDSLTVLLPHEKEKKIKLACYTFCWRICTHTIHMRSTAKFVHGIVLNIHFHWDGSLFVYELAP